MGWMRSLGPYQSLLLLVVPLGIVEPLKLFALLVIADGGWLVGTGLLISMCGASLLVVERLFRVLKPKLLTLKWFAAPFRQWVRFIKGTQLFLGLFR